MVTVFKSLNKCCFITSFFSSSSIYFTKGLKHNCFNVDVSIEINVMRYLTIKYLIFVLSGGKICFRAQGKKLQTNKQKGLNAE